MARRSPLQCKKNVAGPAEAVRRLNILHTVRSLRVDGVGKVVLRNLAKRDLERFDHSLCSLRAESDLAGEFRAIGIEPVFLAYRGMASILPTLGRLVRLMRRLQVDVVHVNRTLDLALAGFAAKLCGIPVVSTIHWLGRLEDHPEDEDRSPWLLRWLEMTATALLNRLLATRIVAVSRAVEESFATLPAFPRDRVEVVYPGLDMQQTCLAHGASRTTSLKLGLEAATPILLNVGRLDAVKGQFHLVPMMRRVREKWPCAKLLIAGEGGLRSELESAIGAAGLEDAIALLGVRSDVDALLANSDLLVLSSESEAAPLPLLEAMRAGKPVVATAVGGVLEIVQNGVTGLIVPRGDAHALADAVLRLLGTPHAMTQMGEAAREAGKRRFDIRHSVRQLEDLYRSMSARRAAV